MNNPNPWTFLFLAHKLQSDLTKQDGASLHRQKKKQFLSLHL